MRVSSTRRSEVRGVEPRGDERREDRAPATNVTTASAGQEEHQQVGDRRDDPPGAIPLAGADEGRDRRDDGRGQRAGRHELEEEVGDPECRGVDVELAADPEARRDDRDPDPAQDARDEEGAR